MLKWKGFQFHFPQFYIRCPRTKVNFPVYLSSQVLLKMFALKIIARPRIKWFFCFYCRFMVKEKSETKVSSKNWKTCVFSRTQYKFPFGSSHMLITRRWEIADIACSSSWKISSSLRTVKSMSNYLNGIHGLLQWDDNYLSVLHCGLFSLEVISGWIGHLLCKYKQGHSLSCSYFKNTVNTCFSLITSSPRINDNE